MEPQLVHKKSKKRRWTKDEKRQRNSKKRSQPINNRMLVCAQKLSRSFTSCVTILKYQDLSETKNNSDNDVSVVTVCNFSDISCSVNDQILIAIKPLLILDINGILCHRIRSLKKDKECSDSSYRTSEATISDTPIILRPRVQEFLDYLSQHFCLAIWTSATVNTAKMLLQTIIPQAQIRNKLLFVWAQNRCDRLKNQDSLKEETTTPTTVFVKSLDKVYNRFPLWNSSNTMLMDDSPEKCPSLHSCNTLHPPPMNGKSISFLQNGQMSDEENHNLQQQFFEQVVGHFTNNTLSSSTITTTTTTQQRRRSSLQDFFQAHAKGHMGWRG